MKKVILKSTLAVVAVTASCLGAWKAYEAYENVDNDLLMENLEALSQDGDNGSGGVDTQYCCKDVTTKQNWQGKVPQCAPGTTLCIQGQCGPGHHEPCNEATLYPDAEPSEKAWGLCLL